MYLGESLFRPSTLTPGSGAIIEVAPSATTSPATTFQQATPPKTGIAAFIENLPNLFLGYTQISMQNKIAKINLERMKQGLPALSAAQTEAYVPRPGVSVGLSPATRNLLMYGGLGLGAILLFGIMTKKKRR